MKQLAISAVAAIGLSFVTISGASAGGGPQGGGRGSQHSGGPYYGQHGNYRYYAYHNYYHNGYAPRWYETRRDYWQRYWYPRFGYFVYYDPRYRCWYHWDGYRGRYLLIDRDAEYYSLLDAEY